MTLSDRRFRAPLSFPAGRWMLAAAASWMLPGCSSIDMDFVRELNAALAEAAGQQRPAQPVRSSPPPSTPPVAYTPPPTYTPPASVSSPQVTRSASPQGAPPASSSNGREGWQPAMACLSVSKTGNGLRFDNACPYMVLVSYCDVGKGFTLTKCKPQAQVRQGLPDFAEGAMHIQPRGWSAAPGAGNHFYWGACGHVSNGAPGGIYLTSLQPTKFVCR